VHVIIQQEMNLPQYFEKISESILALTISLTLTPPSTPKGDTRF